MRCDSCIQYTYVYFFHSDIHIGTYTYIYIHTYTYIYRVSHVNCKLKQTRASKMLENASEVVELINYCANSAIVFLIYAADGKRTHRKSIVSLFQFEMKLGRSGRSRSQDERNVSAIIRWRINLRLKCLSVFFIFSGILAWDDQDGTPTFHRRISYAHDKRSDS